jgi:hypothetical protein
MFVTYYLYDDGAQDLTTAVDRTKTLGKIASTGNGGYNKLWFNCPLFALR